MQNIDYLGKFSIIYLWAFTIVIFYFASISEASGLQWSIIENTLTKPPPVRRYGLMSYDPISEHVVMFGGQKDSDYFSDTWILNPNNGDWTQVETSNNPPGRFSPVGGIVTFPENSTSYLVITTGEGEGPINFNDVWALPITFSNSKLSGKAKWIQLDTSSEFEGPSPRYGSIGGVVDSRKTLVLSHGFDKGERFSTTFELDLSNLPNSSKSSWKKVFHGTNEYNPNKPHARCIGAGTVSNSTNQLMLYGGCLSGGGAGGPCPSNDGWVSTLGPISSGETKWSKVNRGPPASIYGTMVWLEKSQHALLYGGKQTSIQVISAKKSKVNDLDLLNPETGLWNRRQAAGETFPSPRRSPFLAAYIDKMSGQDTAIMWGGSDVNTDSFDDAQVYKLSGNLEETEPNDDSSIWFTIWMLHGILMFLGWGVCLQAGAFVARYMRNNSPPFWFKFHRAVQSTGLVLATIGMILGVVSSSVAGQSPTFLHAILGFIVMFIGLMQPANAFFRPHPGEKYREQWAFGHKLAGRLALVLALVNIPLGLWMALVSSWIIWLYFIALGIFVIVYIGFEYLLRTKWRKESKA